VAGELEDALRLPAALGQLGGGALQTGEALPRSLLQRPNGFDGLFFHALKLARAA